MLANDIYSLEWTGNVKVIGRAFVYNDCLWLSYSGTGIEFICNDGFRALLCADMIAPGTDDGYARVPVLKDGEPILDERLYNKNMAVEIRDAGVHTYTILKLSESANSSLGILELEAYGTMTADDGSTVGLIPAEDKRLKVEFVGDSITCGYGVEGKLGETFTTATENYMKAWAYLTAKKLNADYSTVSKSGAGIISGYTDSGERNLDNIITGYYDLMGCSNVGIDKNVGPKDFEYDFAMEPDLIVILLGTNDISYCRPVDADGKPKLSKSEEKERRKLFYAEYKKFLKHVREKNPLSKIVCALGVLGDGLNDEAEMAVSELRAEGDQRIFWLPLKPQDPADGYGTDYHPSQITQKKLAETISDYVLDM